MNKGNFTMPGEAGYEKLTLQLAKRWGADVIRDSEGTTLSEDILSSGYKIYSTICIIREHNEFAALHPETRAQTFLTTPFITAKGERLEIDLLDSFYKEQFEINETQKALSYLEVWDRSEDRQLAQSEYNYQKGKVTVKTVPFHLYSVSFLSYRIWEEISMYNHVTNSWTKEHLIPIDPRLPVAREYLLSYLDKWIKAHDNTSVVRFTSLFYNFVWIWGSDERNRNLFSDWASYDFSVSEKALEEFETTYGYSLTAEDFINKGKLQVTHMPPTKAKSDYMKLTNSFVAKLGREMVDIVHSYNKKAYVFYDDSWIGLEPYSPLFKTMNFDGLIKCVFSGFEVRLCSGVEVPCHELRLHPYLFPVGLGGAPTFKEGGSPEKDARRYWISVRRALLHSKIERIGLGGYLHLVEKYPLFVDEIEKITKEFNQIKELTSAEKSVPILNKIAVLHTYGSLRSWTLSGHFHETFMHDLIHINEALSGFPAQVEFINFEEAKKDLSQYSVIINAGASLSAWSGSKAWDDIALVENLRRYVANGGVFIGVNEPSMGTEKGFNFALFDVLGVDEDTGAKVCHGKLTPLHKALFTIPQGAFIKGKEEIFLTDKNAVVVNEKEEIKIVVNEYDKGKGIYLTHFNYTVENTRLLLNILLYAMGKTEATAYICDNKFTECAYFSESKKLAVINNSEEPQSTVILTHQGKVTVDLVAGELKILEDIE